jgi:hypothetical protein
VTNLAPDTHEWVSFSDDNGAQWLVDVTFLISNWNCIFGNGCQGVLTGPAPELVQGCCSYGAHFTGEEDRQRVELAATRLSADQWQFKDKGKKGTTKVNKEGEIVTKLVDDACIFLNRPDFSRGAGCALHVLALDNDESFIPLKPEVCWQVPLRKEEIELANEEIITRIGQWNRSDWGAGGSEFQWGCTLDDGAFTGTTRVVDSMREELIAMMNPNAYEQVLAYCNQRTRPGTPLPHPVVRKR